MTRDRLAVLSIAIGAVLVFVSVLADPLGIGVNKTFTFGWKQALGTAAGVALIVAGVVLRRRRRVA